MPEIKTGNSENLYKVIKMPAISVLRWSECLLKDELFDIQNNFADAAILLEDKLRKAQFQKILKERKLFDQFETEPSTKNLVSYLSHCGTLRGSSNEITEVTEFLINPIAPIISKLGIQIDEIECFNEILILFKKEVNDKLWDEIPLELLMIFIRAPLNVLCKFLFNTEWRRTVIEKWQIDRNLNPKAENTDQLLTTEV